MKSPNLSRRQLLAGLGFTTGGLLVSQLGTAQAETLEPFSLIQVNPGQSLLDAIDVALQRSMNLVLPAGIYDVDQTISLPSGVQLTGMGPDTVLRPSNTLTGDAVFSLTDTNGVGLGHFTINGESASSNSCLGIRGSDVANFTLENLIFEQIPGRSIAFWNSQGGFIHECTISNSGGRSIVIGKSQNCQIIGCEITDGVSAAIWLTRGSHNILISSNYIMNNQGHGIDMDSNCYECTLEFNYCHDNLMGIVCQSSRDSFIKGNQVEANQSNGIFCKDCARLQIFGNHCENNGDLGEDLNGYGILLQQTRSSLLTGNICTNNSRGDGEYAGISLEDQGDPKKLCRDNVIIANSCFDDQETPTQDWGINIGNARSLTPDNLIVANFLRGNRKGSLGGERLEQQSQGHNMVDESEFHGAAPPAVPKLQSLPLATEEWRGRLVLVGGNTDALYLCRLSAGQLAWIRI